MRKPVLYVTGVPIRGKEKQFSFALLKIYVLQPITVFLYMYGNKLFNSRVGYIQDWFANVFKNWISGHAAIK